MPPSLRVVPWVNWEEWESLRSAISSGNHAATANMLELYRLRRKASLPLPVQATAEIGSLLDFRIPMDPHVRRLALAMAIVRLVNGSTDRIQPRAEGATARSVHSLAKALKLPPVLVELRHQSSHNALPRLDALVEAGREALSWLESSYWAPQAEIVSNRRSDNGPGNVVSAKAADEPPPRPDCVVKTAKTRRLESMEYTTDTTSSPSPHKSTRKRWRRCRNPEDWKKCPIGLLPGTSTPGQLIGVDVADVIGRNWNHADIVSVNSSSLASRSAGSAEIGTLETSHAEQHDGGKDIRITLEPPNKVLRTLDSNERDTVEQMMRSFL